MNEAVSPGALSTLFTDARTHNGWRETPVSDETLREIYALMKWGPTSANCSPARIVFTRTAEGKERLRPALSSGNLQKTLTAPVTAIVACRARVILLSRWAVLRWEGLVQQPLARFYSMRC